MYSLLSLPAPSRVQVAHRLCVPCYFPYASRLLHVTAHLRLLPASADTEDNPALGFNMVQNIGEIAFIAASRGYLPVLRWNLHFLHRRIDRRLLDVAHR